MENLNLNSASSKDGSTTQASNTEAILQNINERPGWFSRLRVINIFLLPTAFLEIFIFFSWIINLNGGSVPIYLFPLLIILILFSEVLFFLSPILLILIVVSSFSKNAGTTKTSRVLVRIPSILTIAFFITLFLSVLID